MRALLQDIQYGLRMQARTPGLTAFAAFTLALAIAASTTVFSVADAVLVKPLPYTDSERVVIPWRWAPPTVSLGYNEIPWGSRAFHLMAQEQRLFERVGAFKSDAFNLTGAGNPALLDGIRVSAGFFQALRVSPMLGRTFTVTEDRPGSEHSAVLSYTLWQDRFGSDTHVLGRAITLNGVPYEVIGVMPAGFSFPRGEEMPGSFAFPRRPEIWVPLALPPAARPNEPDELAVIARLQPGISIAHAQHGMKILSKRLEAEFPDARGWFESHVIPLRQQVVGDTRLPLLLLLAAVGVVLLIACSNIANLLLANSQRRKSEFALRAALGAGAGRLIRQMLTESLLLAATSGLAGLLLAWAGLDLVKIFGPPGIPRLREATLDLRVFAFAAAVTAASGFLFGLAPAVWTARKDLAASLNECGPRSGGAAGWSRIRDVLFVSEVALALVLVIATGLLVDTFVRLLRIDPGFHPEQVLTFELSLPGNQYQDETRVVSLYQRALDRLESLPGVAAAGVTNAVPMDGATEGSMIRIPGRPAAGPNENPFANYTIASPGYFRAAGTTVLRGRGFQPADTAHSLRVAVINTAMARKFWPNEDPIGKQVALADPAYPPMTVIGVAADVKHVSLRERPGPEMYVPFTQKPYPSMLRMYVVLRTRAAPESVLAGVREVVHGLDRDLPIAKLTTLAGLVDNSLAAPRFSMLLLGAFGTLALLLAFLGMYGVISYGVTQRTREIGIRMALGARPGAVLGLVLGQGARLAGIGIAAGLVMARSASGLMAHFLYGVRPTDTRTFAVFSLLVAAVELLACYLPARRATRIDPTTALRQ
jgi:putative ABC transport system permease protein